MIMEYSNIPIGETSGILKQGSSKHLAQSEFAMEGQLQGPLNTNICTLVNKNSFLILSTKEAHYNEQPKSIKPHKFPDNGLEILSAWKNCGCFESGHFLFWGHKMYSGCLAWVFSTCIRLMKNLGLYLAKNSATGAFIRKIITAD